MKPWIKKVAYVPGVFMFPKKTWVYFDGHCFHACKNYEQAVALFISKIVIMHHRGAIH